MVYAQYELLAIRLAVLVVALHVAACAKPAQTGSGPQAIREESVHVLNGDVNLAGTLVLPNDSKRHPAVVLFHGSGPQARDLFTARWFAKQGVAALAYDKRGVGESTGRPPATPLPTKNPDGPFF
jgi:fermentation-respiration switch protein FrsA (DUF1100 family)